MRCSTLGSLFRCAVSVMILLVWGWTAMADGKASGDREYVLDSGGLRLVVQRSGGRLALTSLSGSGSGEWLAKPGEGAVFWKMALSGPGGKTMELTSSDLPAAADDEHSRGILLGWSKDLGSTSSGQKQELAVSVNISPYGPEPLSSWRLTAHLPEGWHIVRCDFPIIPNIALRDGLKLAAPVGWGLEYDVKPAMGYAGTYPSCQAAMQFVALYGPPHPSPLPPGERKEGSGLYVGVHDPSAVHKHFEVKAREDGVGYACIHWLAPDDSGHYDGPEILVGLFRGGYYDAARIYRDFTFGTPWGKGGPVSKRHIAEWLKDTDLWLMPSAEPLKNVEACRKAGEYFGVPTALHWYNWHQIPFDTLYPDYFPAKEGFAEGVKALKDAGFRVMPYINGRLCDPNSKAWKEEGADKAAARTEDGKPYTEVYGSKVPLNVMCPYTKMWQDKVTSLVSDLVNECGVDAVYIDQISAAAPVRCFNAEHGHPVGGGGFWVRGYRTMLDGIRKKVRAGAMLTTEESAECWIDQLDALLLVNTATTDSARPIPLFPAVYSGRAITFGFQYITHDDISRSLPWRAKMARAFTWGSQLGWVGVERIMASEALKEAEFLRNLARCRRFAHQFVLDGDLLGMIDVRGDNPRMKGEATGSFGGTYHIDMPAVIASAWRGDNGSLGILLANMSDETREVEVTPPFAKVHMNAFAGYTVKTYGPEGLALTDRSSSTVQKVKAAPRSAAVIEMAAR